MAELPILPLNTAALLADTTHMSAEEFGGYCRILFVMWTKGGKLPDVDDELEKICGFSKHKWKKNSKKIRQLLISANGTISQKRLTETWLQVQALRHKRAIAVGSRWSKRKRP